jgi:hypothetical protein
LFLCCRALHWILQVDQLQHRNRDWLRSLSPNLQLRCVENLLRYHCFFVIIFSPCVRYFICIRKKQVMRMVSTGEQKSLCLFCLGGRQDAGWHRDAWVFWFNCVCLYRHTCTMLD